MKRTFARAPFLSNKTHQAEKAAAPASPPPSALLTLLRGFRRPRRSLPAAAAVAAQS